MRALFSLLLFCLPIAAQQPRIIETLPNDQFIVEFNGKEYRMLNPEKVAELAKQKLDLDAALQKVDKRDAEIAVLSTQKELLIEKVSLIEVQRDNARRDLQDARVFIGQQKTLLDEETALRRESAQFIPHSGVKGFWGRLLATLDHPATQSFFKVGIPLWQTWRCN